MVLIAIEAVPAGNRPPAAVRVRISTSERHGFGAEAPLSTRASSLEQGRAGGPVELSPKLARHIGSGSTRQKSYPYLSLGVIPTYHSFCCSGALCALASLGVFRYICLLARRGG